MTNTPVFMSNKLLRRTNTEAGHCRYALPAAAGRQGTWFLAPTAYFAFLFIT